MAENGGYRKPKNPAAVSGPGAASRRTDGQPSEDNMKQAKRYVTGMGYGENKELNEIQAQGDLAGASTPANVSPTPVAPRMPISDIPTIDAMTQRPEEPFTAGLSSGEGPGPESLMGTPEYIMNQEDIQKIAFTYGILMRAAEQPGASQATRELARKVRSMLD
jgi:hypothetical protein